MREKTNKILLKSGWVKSNNHKKYLYLILVSFFFQLHSPEKLWAPNLMPHKKGFSVVNSIFFCFCCYCCCCWLLTFFLFLILRGSGNESISADWIFFETEIRRVQCLRSWIIWCVQTNTHTHTNTTLTHTYSFILNNWKQDYLDYGIYLDFLFLILVYCLVYLFILICELWVCLFLVLWLSWATALHPHIFYSTLFFLFWDSSYYYFMKF